MSEIYVNITDYPNYQGSNFGSVKNINTDKILKGVVGHFGYLGVSLYNSTGTKNKTIHSLVADAFIPNPAKKKNVDHILKPVINNNVTNLRWATAEENQHNRIVGKNSTSGVVGVSYIKSEKKWRASIKINTVRKSLGCFVNKDDAIRARHDAEVLHFGEFRRV